MSAFPVTAPLLRSILAISGRNMPEPVRLECAAIIHYAGLRAPVTGIPSTALHRDLILRYVAALDVVQQEHERHLFANIVSQEVLNLIEGWAMLDMKTSAGERRLFSPTEWLKIARRVMVAVNAGDIGIDWNTAGVLMEAAAHFGGAKLFHNKNAPARHKNGLKTYQDFKATPGFAFALDHAEAWLETAEEVFQPIDHARVANSIHVIDLGHFIGGCGSILVRTGCYGHIRVAKPKEYEAWRRERTTAKRAETIRNVMAAARTVGRPVVVEDGYRGVGRSSAKVAKDCVRMAKARC